MLASLFSVLCDGFAYGMLLFLLSVGLSVTLGMMNFVNLAHCSFAMVGGYVTVTLANAFGWPFFATLPAAFLSAAAASVVLERTLYRRLYRASDLDQCLFTIGIVFISVAAAAYLYGTLQQPINTPTYLQGAVEFLGMRFGVYRLFLIVTALVITAILVAALEYTRFGAQVRAAVDNPRMARGLGVDVDRAFAITFALGGGLAGLGGALAIDLILGYAGIVSLGHAAFFGLGAYAAGLLSKHAWGEPLSGLLIASAVSAAVGYAMSFIIARFRHLALIMITLGLGLLLHEAANSASWLTGGADGLQGMKIRPLFETFRFDLYGRTAYTYSVVVLFLTFLAARRIIHSPCGLAFRGIRENATRMPAIGAPSHAHLRKIYTLSAAMAGVAGALLAQTTSTVSLEVLSFQRSADVLVILILGGAGRLYGGIGGAIIHMVARDRFSGISPQFWYFWIGLLLVVVVMFLPNGILGGLAKITARWQRKAP